MSESEVLSPAALESAPAIPKFELFAPSGELLFAGPTADYLEEMALQTGQPDGKYTIKKVVRTLELVTPVAQRRVVSTPTERKPRKPSAAPRKPRAARATKTS